MPVIGIRLTVIPTFSNTWVNSSPRIPNTTRLLKDRSPGGRSGAGQEEHQEEAQREQTPTKPSSSPTTEKTKSVCCSGRKASRFWGPW